VRIVKKMSGGWQIGHMAQGAAGAEGVRLGEGMRLGSGCPPPQSGWGLGLYPYSEIFLTLWLKIVHFGVYSDKNSQFIIE